ncbi:MAG: hypothetical protein AB7F89_11705 [Pirellulaceae bacterium]
MNDPGLDRRAPARQRVERLEPAPAGSPGPFPSRLTWQLACGLVATLLFAGGTWGADLLSADEQLLAGLRERRLYDLAEFHCRRQLAHASNAAEQRELTVELLRTLTEHAIQSAPEQRAGIWQQFDKATAEYLATREHTPSALVVRTQAALGTLARGELARAESDVAPARDAALEEARLTIRQATRLLEQLEQDLAEAIPASRRANPADAATELSPDELLKLQTHVLYELARAFRNQALCYPASSPDRVAALTQSLAPLERLNQHVALDDDLARQVTVARAECHRLLKDFPAAISELEALQGEGVPAPIRLRARAETIRTHLDRGDLAAARRVMEAGRQDRGVTSAELDFAFLECYVAQWQADAEAKRTNEAAQWQEKAIAAVKYVEQNYGPYWGRRAEILLVRVGGQHGGGNVEILRRAADDLYLKGRFEEALAAYDQAAARQPPGSTEAFDLAYKAALVQRQRHQHADAARRFRDLALGAVGHSQAPGAHLLGIVHLAEWCRTDASQIGQYESWLREHLATWPYARSAPQAWLWLGRLMEAEQEWLKAIAAYQSIPEAADSYAESLAGAERCWTAFLSSKTAQGDRVADLAGPAIRFFHDAAWSQGREPPARWTATNRQAALAVARLQLRFTTTMRGETEQLLRQAIEGQPPAPADWLTTARLVLAVVMADQPGRMPDARQLIADIEDTPPEEVLTFTRLVRELGNRSPQGKPRRELAELALAASDSVWARKAELAPAVREELTRLRAQAHADASNFARAVALMNEVIAAHPEEMAYRQELAEMLLPSHDAAILQRALDSWRIVAAQSPPRSPAWFRAKHGTARTMLQQGDAAGAAKLIRYLQATEQLEKYGWEQPFQELLRQTGAGR